MVRPLYLEFPQDPAAYTHLDQYLLGEDVLVAPVSIPGKRTTQQVYLPAGRWVDYFTGSTYQGPGTHQVMTTWGHHAGVPTGGRHAAHLGWPGVPGWEELAAVR